MDISGETRDIAKEVQNVGKVVYVSFNGCHEHCRIIRIKGGSCNRTTATNLVELSSSSRQLKIFSLGGQWRWRRGEGKGVPLMKVASMGNGVADHTL